MSEATVQAPVQTPTSIAHPPIATVASIGDLLKKPRVPINQPAKAEETPKEAPKEEVKAEVPPVVEKTPEPAKETPQAPVKGSPEDSLVNLRKKAEKAEKEAAEFRAKLEAVEKEREELKSKPFELPDDIKTRLEKAEQEREFYSKELMTAKLERHPEFQAKYQKGIESSVQTMQQIAIEAGVDKDLIKAGMGNWDQTAFGEWHESMNPVQKAKFAAAWMKSEELFAERNEKLSKAEQEWQELSKAQEIQFKTQHEESLNQNTKLAKSLLKSIVLDNEGCKDFEDLPAAAEAVAMKAARYEMTPEEVFQNVIHNQVLARVTVKQKSTIEQMTEQISEKDKKIAELEQFVADKSSATPRPNASGVITQGKEQHVPIWQRAKIEVR